MVFNKIKKLTWKVINLAWIHRRAYRDLSAKKNRTAVSVRGNLFGQLVLNPRCQALNFKGAWGQIKRPKLLHFTLTSRRLNSSGYFCLSNIKSLFNTSCHKLRILFTYTRVKWKYPDDSEKTQFLIKNGYLVLEIMPKIIIRKRLSLYDDESSQSHEMFIKANGWWVTRAFNENWGDIFWSHL